MIYHKTLKEWHPTQVNHKVPLLKMNCPKLIQIRISTFWAWRLGESCFHDMPFPIVKGTYSYTAESGWTKLRHSHIAQMNDKLHDQLQIRTAERPGVVLNGRVRGSTSKIMQHLETAICQSNFMHGKIKNYTITKTTKVQRLWVRWRQEFISQAIESVLIAWPWTIGWATEESPW